MEQSTELPEGCTPDFFKLAPGSQQLVLSKPVEERSKQIVILLNWQVMMAAQREIATNPRKYTDIELQEMRAMQSIPWEDMFKPLMAEA